MRHNDPRDRPEDEFGGVNTLHTGTTYPSITLLPHIPDLASSI